MRTRNSAVSGKEIELSEVVLETNMAASDPGVNLLLLGQILEKHGISASAVLVDQWRLPSSEGILLIHIDNADDTGHFAVAFPDASQRCWRFWSWPSPVRIVTDEEIGQLSSGPALYIEIDDTVKSTKNVTKINFDLLAVSLTFLLTSTIAFGIAINVLLS